jgi:hypothetical protein
VKPIAWFGTDSPLVSGWAWGEGYLKNGVVAFEAPIGKGKFYAFGPEITFRAQAHNTFKMLFNQLYHEIVILDEFSFRKRQKSVEPHRLAGFLPFSFTTDFEL